MAMGVPVVASNVAAGGVDALAEQHLLVGNSPQQYAGAILRILENPAERARLSRDGRARMLSHHSWAHSMRRLDGIIERCLSRASQRSPQLEKAPQA
jgi:glycosyltransferase involved in cell wall biosynthesis